MLLLIFHVGANLYAIDSSHVVEVIPRVSYRAVHHVPDYVVGVFNYRGAIVPAIDLCQMIRGTPSQEYLSTRVMMVSYPCPDGKLRHLGLMAERVIETLDRSESDFKETGIGTNDARYLGGIITDKKGMIQQFFLDRLFADIQQINLLNTGV